MPTNITPENISNVLNALTERGASDIRLQTGHPPLAEINGRWSPQTEYEGLPGDTVLAIHRKLCRDERYLNPQDNLPFDGDYRTSTGVWNFRVSGGKENGRLFLSLRPLPREVPNFDKLRLLDDTIGEPPPHTSHLTEGFKYVLAQKRGLILVSGATGSGKSTTLASLIQYINCNYPYNIVTIEDPIEFVFRPRESQFIQREVGVDTKSFSMGLRAALRQKPNIILVGELRDAETMDAAFRAAATGHLVLATVHNIETAQIIERILNEFPADQHTRVRYAMAETLLAAFAQQIVPTIGGGRQVIHEALVLTPESRSILRPKEGQSGGYLQELREVLTTKNPYGSRSMDRELKRAVIAGLITEEEAYAHAVHPSLWSKE